jgi:Putative inner membrane exporter, YdcZ
MHERSSARSVSSPGRSSAVLRNKQSQRSHRRATARALASVLRPPVVIPWHAALALFAIGFVVVAAWAIVIRVPLPSLETLRHVPAYGYFGGFIVAS